MFHRQFGARLRPRDHSKTTLPMSLSMHFGSRWAIRPGGRGCQPVGVSEGTQKVVCRDYFRLDLPRVGRTGKVIHPTSATE